jgi:hypothetical protein
MNLQEAISKFTPSNHKMYYTWRRFKSRETLGLKHILINRIRFGDFDFSDYKIQAEYELTFSDEDVIKRYNKIMEDYNRDENEILFELEQIFCKYFRISKEQYYQYIEQCDGTIEDLYDLVQSNTHHKFINIFKD